MLHPPTDVAVATACAVLLFTTPAHAQAPAPTGVPAPTGAAELDAQRLVVRGKATGAIGLGALGLGGFFLVGGLASSSADFEDEGTTGKRLAAAGFGLALTGALVAVAGVATYLAGHRRLHRLHRARLAPAWLPGGAAVHVGVAF